MSSASAVDSLHALLVEDEEQKKREKEEREERKAKSAPLQQKVNEIWQTHGMKEPITGTWVRPISSSLYRCPLSAPQTMLAPWKSLPRSIQSRIKTPPKDTEHGVVEVPRAYMMPTEDEVGTSSNLQGRPLGGNLTNKLKEYTRGVAGQTRPFRAGGMDENRGDGADEVPEFQSPKEILQARQVLEKGSEASWKDGTILTAPPGATFDVGLSWNDVYKTPEPITKGCATKVETDDNISDEEVNTQKLVFHTEVAAPSSSRPATSGGAMWERSFFDDDSLFGNSTDEEESHSESEESEDDHTSEQDMGETKTDVSTVDADKKKREEPRLVDEHISTATDEVDDLLTQLSVSEDASLTKKKVSIDIRNNPLHLAQEQAEMAQNTTRKSWAVTAPLPIDDFNSLIPNPAMTFPFTLDDFQQQAVARLERSESIFVAAHTSAGKTVCAEYAVSLCRQHCTRAVYTSPIKALSNQKFRDFCVKFGAENVGLVTGDMQLNVDDSTVLIMTTEILRSMLYRGADLIRDIEYVIFDEVHYINDSERGVVWEEVIIMLPQYVNMIFLSATTPNTIEFSDWIGRTKRKPIHVIRTNYRPVPLSHFLWAGLKLHLLMQGQGGFLDKGYNAASKALLPSKDSKDQKGKSTGSRPSSGSRQQAWQQQGSKSNWMSLIRFLEREELTPTVVFSFSKKKCEEIANMLRSLDLNTAAERSAVQAFTIQTVARLSPNDSTLPQVMTVCEMVKRGIGVHHGGLLPILKEMVEILFSRNLIKVLFATETFAMGVNMPARAVVFNSLRKHDGVNFRELEPGEYVQMAGRAGRRGLDTIGTVIVCCFGEVPPPMPILRTMLTGSSTKLQSQFRLTYNMIMNLLRVEDMSVEGMIKRSFSEFATQRALTANEYPKLLAKGERTLAKLSDQFQQDASSRIGAEDLEDYFAASSELLATNGELLTYIMESVGGNGGDAFIPGRIILVTSARKHGYARSPAMVLRPPSTTGGLATRNAGDTSGSKAVICLVLLPESYVSSSDESVKQKTSSKPGTVNYVGNARRRHYAIHEIALDEIFLVSSSKHKVDVKAILKDDAKSSSGGGRVNDPFANAVPAGRRGGDFDAFMGMKTRAKKSDEDFFGGRSSTKAPDSDQVIEKVVGNLVEAEKKEADSILTPMDLRDCVKQGGDVLEFRKHCSRVEELVARARSFESHNHPALETHYAAIERKETLRNRIDTLRHLLSNEALQLFPDFLQRKSVLQTLGYVDENDTVCIKGRVACEVNTCEELIVTEMVFEGILNELEPAEIIAALSALVYQAKSSDDEFDAELPGTLVECCMRMKKVATNLGQLQKEHGLEIDPADYCEASLKFGLVHVVYEWALGVPFSSICELTLEQEGSIVRCITRLDELCREVRNCARVVGNPTLYRTMETASMAIKRDIVFASSLYVS